MKIYENLCNMDTNVKDVRIAQYKRKLAVLKV